MKISMYLMVVMLAANSNYAFGMQALAEKQKKIAQQEASDAAKNKEEEKAEPKTVAEFFAVNKKNIESYIDFLHMLDRAAYDVNIDSYNKAEKGLTSLEGIAKKTPMMSECLQAGACADLYEQKINEKIEERLRDQLGTSITKDDLLAKAQAIKAHMDEYEDLLDAKAADLTQNAREQYRMHAQAYSDAFLAGLIRIAKKDKLSQADIYALEKETAHQPPSNQEVFFKDHAKDIAALMQIMMAIDKAAYDADVKVYQSAEDELAVLFPFVQQAKKAGVDIIEDSAYTTMYQRMINKQLRQMLKDVSADKKQAVIQAEISKIIDHIKTYDSLVERRMFVDNLVKEHYKKSAIEYANNLLVGWQQIAKENEFSLRDMQAQEYKAGSFPSVEQVANPKKIEELPLNSIRLMSEKELAQAFGFSPAFQNLLTKSGYAFIADLSDKRKIYQQEIDKHQVSQGVISKCESQDAKTCSEGAAKLKNFEAKIQRIAGMLKGWESKSK